MKRNLLFIVAILFVCTGILYLQLGCEPVVNHSTIMKNSDTYDLSLVITLNKLVILNRKNVERMLIQKTLDNDFENVLFSYDVHGMPRNIFITVHTNAMAYTLDLPAFEFQFSL